jgi:iron complex outermembrane receptor protein
MPAIRSINFRCVLRCRCPTGSSFDLWLRYVSRLGDKDSPLGVPAYTTLDLRYAWRPTRDLEVSLVGQNLLDHSHPEFVPGLLPSQQLELQRGMYVKAKWQF